jgi:adenylate cyclase
MKRPLLPALIIGLIAAAIVLGLHASRLISGPEIAIKNLLLNRGPTTRSVLDQLQYPLVLILACGVAWMTFMTPRRARLGGFIAILLVELLGVAWVCSLYQVFFQPLPTMAAAALGFLLPIGFLELTAYLRRRRERAPVLSVEAVAAKPRPRPRRSDPVPEAVAQACEVTAVVCDIANKHDLAEECEPAVFVEITEKFLAHATEAFRKAGAYIESAGGEGVVAIFGYPESDKQHAEKATRKAMALTQAFSDSRKSGKSDGPATIGVHAGVSSGIMIMAPVKNNGQRSLLATGEPVELARRFCIANRFYGSRVLLGPRTFELASKILVARPIDFLSGVDVRERHEIYEPVALALDASRDQITRRDAFWNGVVLYREKRWAEAYSQFQNARGPEGEEDRPLQLYLRRLEPLALQLTNTPLDE